MPQLRYLDTWEVAKIFGDPTPYVDATGNVNRTWENRILEKIALPSPLPLSWQPATKVTLLRCHKLVADRLNEVLWKIHENQEAWNSINDTGGCYCWRPNRRNPRQLSRHSWGIAIDLDSRDNPLGGVPKMHPFIVETFASYGFIWGGRFKKLDPMHFEPGTINGWEVKK